MKKLLKVLAVLIIAAHIFALLIYIGIIPAGLFQNLKFPEAGRLAEYILSLQNSLDEDGKEPLEENGSEEGELTDSADEPETAEDSTETGEADDAVSPEEENRIRIELSETLPEIEEGDLYDLTEVLINAGALRAVDGKGGDYSDQIVCELAADITNPGHFTAVFSVKDEDGQIERGPSADLQVELTEPFLALREVEVTVTAGEEYDPYGNILICMDVDGTVLTEYVALDGYLNTDLSGEYELRFIIYSRVNGSSASRNVMIHVAEE